MKAGSFVALATALLLATASLAAAQQPVLNPPPALPPAPAALSVPNPFAGLQPGVRDLYQSPDRSDRFQHLSRHPAPPIIILPGVYIPGPYYMPFAGMGEYQPPAPRVVIARGGLVLETLPDFTQVYVDGFYVGLAQEFGLRGRALELSAGAHRVELRAPGYDTLSFSVMIAPNGILRYRGDMQALSSAAPPRAAQQPAPQKSFYVIPNCYAGDKPPDTALPKGCDVGRMKVKSIK